eukprot:1538821-Heterocapsa_arctica.AAC.1
MSSSGCVAMCTQLVDLFWCIPVLEARTRGHVPPELQHAVVVDVVLVLVESAVGVPCRACQAHVAPAVSSEVVRRDV